jgi:MFS family permease
MMHTVVASEELDVDMLLEEAGSFGPFQHKYIVLLGLPWIVCGCLTMVHLFVAIPPADPPACPLPQNASVPQLPGAASSLMLEWGLMCGREHEADVLRRGGGRGGARAPEADVLEAGYMAGMLFGAGILGNVADRLGRRPALMICALFSFVGACWSAVAVSYLSYLLSRALTGFFVAGLGLVCFVHTSEILAQDRRVILVVSGTVLFALGVAALSQVARQLQSSWRLVHWAAAVSCGSKFS